MLPVGTRVRFVHRIIEGATGDHPDFLLCEEGDEGTVTGHGERYPLLVKPDNGNPDFYCDREEVDPTENTAPGEGE